MRRLVNAWATSSLEEKLLWAFIILMPFCDMAHVSVGAKRIAYPDLIIGAAFIVCLTKLATGALKFKKTSMESAYLLMACSFLFSFLNSSNLLASVTELAGLVYVMILFLFIATIISTPDKLIFALRLFFITAAVLSLAGLSYFVFAALNPGMPSDKFLQYSNIEAMAHHFPRIKLMFESSNMLLTYLHAAFIAGIALLFTEKTRKAKVIILTALLIMFITSFLTGSRRFTGLLLSLFIVLCWFGRGRIVNILKHATFLGFLVFLVVSILTSIWVVFPAKIVKDEVRKDIGISLNYAYSLHLLPFVSSVSMFKGHPIAGIGIGTYNEHFKEHVDWQWVRASFGFEAYPLYVEKVEKKTLNFDPHSSYLGTLAETGVVGFAGLCYVFFNFLRPLISKIRRSKFRGGLGEVLPRCILAGLMGFLLNGTITDILMMRHFWFMMALGFLPMLDETGKHSGTG